MKRLSCQNCGGNPLFAKGWCCACYFYDRRYGTNRPEYLWLRQHQKNGIYCDCGQKATHSIDIIVSKQTHETMLLCDNCYALENMD